MIRANREVIPDRKLFQLLYNHRLSSGLKISANCDPDYQIALNQFMENVMHSLARLETIYMDQISLLENRLEQITNYCARLHAIIKSKKQQNNLYSFGNSPMSKPSSQIPQSASKHYKQTTIFSPSLSTQPQTKKKPQQFPSTESKPDHTLPYFQQKLHTLFNQITQLRYHIDIAHPSHRLPEKTSIQFDRIFQSPIYQSHEMPTIVKRLSSLRQYWDNQEKSQDTVMMRSQLEKCRAVIKQYEKQESMMKMKVEKYKAVLGQVLKWLAYLKDVELKNYLPCQACDLKQMIWQYLNQKTSIQKQAQHREQHTNDRDSLLVEDEDHQIHYPSKKQNTKLMNTPLKRRISVKNETYIEDKYQSLLQGEDNQMFGNWGNQQWGAGQKQQDLQQESGGMRNRLGNSNLLRQSVYQREQSMHDSAQNDDSD